VFGRGIGHPRECLAVDSLREATVEVERELADVEDFGQYDQVRAVGSGRGDLRERALSVRFDAAGLDVDLCRTPPGCPYIGFPVTVVSPSIFPWSEVRIVRPGSASIKSNTMGITYLRFSSYASQTASRSTSPASIRSQTFRPLLRSINSGLSMNGTCG
jgi:hypothetical protein